MRKCCLYDIFLILCLFCFYGCGLDAVYYLNAPSVSHNTPTYATEYDNRYFEFTTNEKQPDDIDYLGTAVYYKIYNNYSTMQSNISTLSSLSSSTNESAAATKMIESFGYKQLGTSNGAIMPLIPAATDNQRVYIRLSNYQESVSSDYIAEIRFRNDASPSSLWVRIGVPLRTGSRYTFDFGRKEDEVADNSSVDSALSVSGKNLKNAVPSEDDVSSMADVVYYSSFSDSDKKVWYADLYAVAVGQDSSFTQYYSNLLHLGSVSIDSSVDNN